ncbi:MAG TPA: hypothetical protein VK826_20795 [Bacteroidia bacterium]|nr:hypothetical protein [Bacteroidia bacterium]
MLVLLVVVVVACIQISEVITRSNDGSYRDCSGLALPFRVVICVYALAFFLWSGAIAIAAKTINQTRMIVQIVLIGILGVLPTAAWTTLIICFMLSR